MLLGTVSAGDETLEPGLSMLIETVDRHYRLLGQEVVLEDAVQVGICLAISIRVAANFYQSEVRRAARQALGTGPGGFFELGNEVERACGDVDGRHVATLEGGGVRLRPR